MSNEIIGYIIAGILWVLIIAVLAGVIIAEHRKEDKEFEAWEKRIKKEFEKPDVPFEEWYQRQLKSLDAQKYIAKEYLTRHLNKDLDFIENTENYHAMFKYVIANCATAPLASNLLLIEGIISEEEHLANLKRVQQAQELAVKTHGEWTVTMLEQSDTQHTTRTLVSSVYFDIFGIKLKNEEKK